MVAEADRDRELYAQRAALAEEGQELAREDRKLLQVSCLSLGSHLRFASMAAIFAGRFTPVHVYE